MQKDTAIKQELTARPIGGSWYRRIVYIKNCTRKFGMWNFT